jgi:ferredoxin
MRVVVDPDLCQGHARCNLHAPAVFGLTEDDGHALVLLDPVPAVHEEAARKAAIACPERAIAVVDDG